MADYTKLNLKQDVEDMAKQFDLSPGLESRFARKPLEPRAVGLQLLQDRAGLPHAVRPHALRAGGALRRRQRQRAAEARRRGARAGAVGRRPDPAGGDALPRGRAGGRRGARVRRARHGQQGRGDGAGLVERLTQPAHAIVPESCTRPRASTWLKSSRPGRSTSRVAVGTPVATAATGWSCSPASAELVAAGAGDEHVDAVDRREPAVEVVVADDVDGRAAGERGPQRLLVGAVAVQVVGDDVAAAVPGGDPAAAGMARDLLAQPRGLDRRRRLGRVGDQLPAGLVDVGAVAGALAVEAATALPVRVVAAGAALELVVAEDGVGAAGERAVERVVVAS